MGDIDINRLKLVLVEKNSQIVSRGTLNSTCDCFKMAY